MLESLRTRLQWRLIMAFGFVMLLPTLGIALYTLHRVEAILIQQIKTDQLSLATAYTKTIESQITEAGTDFLFILQSQLLHEFIEKDPEHDRALANLFAQFLNNSLIHYSALCALELNGRERICVREGVSGYTLVPSEQLRNRHVSPAFIAALRRGNSGALRLLAITGGEPGAGGAPVLLYSLRFSDATGRPAGVLILEAPITPLLLALADSDSDVATSVVNQTGIYIFTNNRNLIKDGQQELRLLQSHPQIAQQILTQRAGVLIDPPAHPGRFFVFTRLQPTAELNQHWTVIYERPLAKITTEIEKTRFVIIGLTLGALLIALSLALVFARGIVRPIKALASAAERIGRGDLLTPIPQTHQGEIGALGRTLAQTVTRLRISLELAEQRRSEAETLAAASRALGATLDREQVLDLILSELRRVVPFDSASVQEVRGEEAVIIACYGLLEETEQKQGMAFALKPGMTPNAAVAARRAPLILDDAPLHYPYFHDTPFNSDPIRGWMGVPMLFGERLIGMITLDKHEVGFYSERHAGLALAFASQAAAAMENARLYAAAQRELDERRRAEAALARLAAIIEATPDLVGMANGEGNMLFFNRAGMRLLAIEHEAELQTLRVADFFPPRLLPWLRTEIIPLVYQEGTWSGETTLLARSGEEIPVSQVIICHYGPDGKPELLSTIARDIRERQRAEDELRQAQKMEALGRLAGGLAHDFNNLLTVILGEVDLLLFDLPAESELRASAEHVRSSGMRASALTSQLLAFSRRQVFQVALINLNLVLGDIEQMLRRLIGEHIALHVELDADLPLIQADPIQMQQVVMNLAINARDAMPAGGTLQISTRGVAVDEANDAKPSHTPAGRYVLLVVRDTGMGIEEEVRDHIFEPFFTTKERGKGTGLGLATVHGIVRQSGGQIDFESISGEGTTFRIYLPAVEKCCTATVEANQRSHMQPSQPRSGTILLVEDDEDVRKLTAQILRRHGFTLLIARDGPTALALAREHQGKMDVLLTDVVMPGGMNGVQIAAALSAERQDLRVIYMSGYTDNTLVEPHLRDGVAIYIQKPFTPEGLIAALQEVLAEGERREV
ncbi:MAG: response regulator [Candidatus Viridilinea halotolerans]|uniref:histidine kinase n=1 Tax=Candidatus Viridilinea halotolerans TaxID=2491704 RepID=A0A426TR16_9CHLR|nr:MAG: response regulator [Candidatus Viridilinea halotolerans]